MLGLICVDVDGALIGTDNTVRDDVWAALADARARGVRIALCSGRPAIGNALEYARRHPARTARVVVVNPWVHFPDLALTLLAEASARRGVACRSMKRPSNGC